MGQCCQSKLEPRQPEQLLPIRAPRLAPSESILRYSYGSPPETDALGQETIRLTNFSDGNLTGLLIHVEVAGQEMALMPDTGNNCMIIQYNSYIAQKDSAGKWAVLDPSYTILDADVREPWGNPALLVSGPMKLGTRKFNLQFFMKKSPDDKFGNLGMNFVGDVWWSRVNESGKTVYPSVKASAMMCPMLASAWNYFQIHLIPSEGSNSQSKLVFSDHADFLSNAQMLKLMNTAVAQVRCGAYSLEMNDQVVSAQSSNDMIAMIDSGGGPILCSNPAAIDIAAANTKSNGQATFNWPATGGNEVGEVKWLSEVQAAFLLKESEGDSAVTILIPPAAYTQLASIQHNRYLNGQDGFNLGAQLFQYHRVVFDVKRARVGFAGL